MILNDSLGEHHDAFSQVTSNRYGNERDHHSERTSADGPHCTEYVSRYGLKLSTYGRHELEESLELVMHFVRWSLFSLRLNRIAAAVVELDRCARLESGSPNQASMKHTMNLWIVA